MSSVRIFKVVARWADLSNRPSWIYRGKVGTQAKKTVYTNFADFKRYSPEILRRWKEVYGCVEIYETKNGKWVRSKEKEKR